MGKVEEKGGGEEHRMDTKEVIDGAMGCTALIKHIVAKFAFCVVFKRIVTILAEKADAIVEVVGDTSHASSSGPTIEKGSDVDALQGRLGLVFQGAYPMEGTSHDVTNWRVEFEAVESSSQLVDNLGVIETFVFVVQVKVQLLLKGTCFFLCQVQPFIIIIGILGHILAEFPVGKGKVHGKGFQVPLIMGMRASKSCVETKEGHSKFRGDGGERECTFVKNTNFGSASILLKVTKFGREANNVQVTKETIRYPVARTGKHFPFHELEEVKDFVINGGKLTNVGENTKDKDVTSKDPKKHAGADMGPSVDNISGFSDGTVPDVQMGSGTNLKAEVFSMGLDFNFSKSGSNSEQGSFHILKVGKIVTQWNDYAF